jgi:hypothetical protein
MQKKKQCVQHVIKVSFFTYLLDSIKLQNHEKKYDFHNWLYNCVPIYVNHIDCVLLPVLVHFILKIQTSVPSELSDNVFHLVK